MLWWLQRVAEKMAIVSSLVSELWLMRSRRSAVIIRVLVNLVLNAMIWLGAS
jgi:hypothetical protein